MGLFRQLLCIHDYVIYKTTRRIKGKKITQKFRVCLKCGKHKELK